jgi:hypothetical protein
LITRGWCRSEGEATTGSCEVPISTSPFSASALSKEDFATFVTQIIKRTAPVQQKKLSVYNYEGLTIRIIAATVRLKIMKGKVLQAKGCLKNL